MGRGYGQEPRRRRPLTPLESELRPSGWEFERERRRNPVRRALRRLRRRREPPKTLAGALARGLVRLAVTVAVGAAVAALLVRWLDRPLAVGFYIVGGALLAAAFFLSAADMETPDYALAGEPHEREYRVNSSFAYVLMGLVLIGVGVVLETSG